MDPNVPAVQSLEALPTEILEHIALYLVAYPSGFPDTSPRGLRSFISFRGSSKTIEAKTRHAFGRICFGKYAADYSPAGLRRLRRLASHADFARAVTTLVFERQYHRMNADGEYELMAREVSFEFASSRPRGSI